jgi:hypothetical protein
MDKPRVIYWSDSVYNTQFLFMIGDIDKCAKIAKRKYHVIAKTEDIREIAQGLCWWYPTFGNVIWLRKFNKTKEGMGYLVHECLHALFNLFEDKGITHSKEGEEAYCYYLQDIVRFFLTQWEKKQNK